MAMKMFRTLRNIISRHPLIGYGAVVLLVAGSAFFIQHPYWGMKPPPLNAPFSMTSALLVIIPLAWRRFFLVLALTFLMVALVAVEVLNVTIGVNLSSIALIMAVFSASAYGGRWRNLACAASICTFNGGPLYKLMFSGNVVFLSSATLFNIIGLLWILVTSLTTWWLGNRMRLSRERTSLSRASTEQVLRGSQKNARWAVFYELGRIVQGLYGILTHNFRAIGIQARAARQFLKRYFKKVLNFLDRIRQSIRYIVVEVCRIFGPLWDEKHFETCTAKSGLPQLEKLATDVQTSGLQVKVKVEGEKREVPQTA
jgi:hypothetical protein